MELLYSQVHCLFPPVFLSCEHLDISSPEKNLGGGGCFAHPLNFLFDHQITEESDIFLHSNRKEKTTEFQFPVTPGKGAFCAKILKTFKYVFYGVSQSDFHSLLSANT